MESLKAFLTSIVLFGVLDFIWLGYVMNRFNIQQLQEIGRVSNGRFEVWIGPAIAAYLLMAVLMTFFVLPLTNESSNLSTFLVGALMGLSVYGIYDMTNLAILKNYPLPFAVADMAWGTFLFGTVALLSEMALKTFTSP